LTLFPRILASAALLALLHAASAQTPASTPAAGPAADPAVDPYTWLEDVQGEAPELGARAQCRHATAAAARPDYERCAATCWRC
jgi:hypothetical protein